jgi:amino acid adenylation domain-containing protein
LKIIDKKILHHVIDAVSTSCPDKIAIEQEDNSFTYQELLETSNRIARALLNAGVLKGEVVGVYLPSSFDYVCSIIGVNKSGCVFMPIDMSYPKFRLQYVFQKVLPKKILTNAIYKEKLITLIRGIWLDEFDFFEVVVIDGEVNVTVVSKSNIEPYNAVLMDDSITIEVSGEDGNYLMYTSGSTGNPKAIEGSHKSLSHFIHWQIGEFELDANVKVSQLAPLLFDVSLRDIFVPLVAGGTLVIPPDEIKGDPEKLFRWVIRKEITLMHMVPSIFRIFTKCVKRDNGKCLERLQLVFLAGEPLYGYDVNEWFSVVGSHITLVNLYGPSETTLAKLFYRIPFGFLGNNAIVPLGEPISNTLILILKNSKLCEVGEIGEIFIKTPFASKGYYKDTALTDASFIQNPLHDTYRDIIYKTGDLGRYRKDRKVEYVGRADSMVKIRGNRVELQEVEKIIRNYPGVTQVLVIALPNLSNEQQIVCYCLKDDKLDINALKEFIKDYLLEYMHPSYFVLIDEFPLNLNGKINKQVLPRPEEMLYERTPYYAPQTQLEEDLAALWSEILHIKKVGVHNSFFDLGGNSLSATRVVSKICKITGKELHLKDFFDHPTVRQLAGLLNQKEVSSFESIPVLPVLPDYELSSAQKRLWVLDKLDDNKGAFNVHLAFHIEGSLDKEALRRAFEILVERHEALRTVFTAANSEPRQVISDIEMFSFNLNYTEKLDLSESDLRNHLESAQANPFDLVKGPLWRAKVIACGNNKFIFSLTLHHIICDAWSIEVLIKEIINVYNTLRKGSENYKCVPLKFQYKDYAAWQNAKLNGDESQILQKYWLSLFQNGVPDFKLVTEFSRPVRKSYVGRTIKRIFKNSIKEGLYSLSNQQRTSLFMNLLSAVEILLYRYSGQSDILVGSPFVGREHPDLKDQIGFYVNILPLYIKVDREDEVADILQQVKRRTLEAFEHQVYPFNQLINDLQISRTADRSPMFDIRVELHTALKVDGTLSNLVVTQIETEEQISQYDLTFRFLETEQDISLALNYSTVLYSSKYIEYVILHVQEVLEQMICNTRFKVGDLQLTGVLINNPMEKQLNTSFDFN